MQQEVLHPVVKLTSTRSRSLLTNEQHGFWGVGSSDPILSGYLAHRTGITRRHRVLESRQLLCTLSKI
jgi:hypothetical protein